MSAEPESAIELPPDVSEADKVRGWKAMADVLQVHVKTVKRWAVREEDRLPVWHDHRGYWISSAALAAWIKQQVRPAAEHLKAA